MAEIRFDRRMSDADALMWAIEKDPLLRSTITAVSILDRAPDRARFEDQIERATRTVPRLRQRVVASPLHVAPPEYVIDPNFDIRYHVRWMGAPGDGSLRSLLDLTAPLAMQGFDRARPLWEFVVVEGLEGGRAALIQKLHHSLTDGVGAMRISMAFLDTRPDGREQGPMPDAPRAQRPGAAALLRDALADRARRRFDAARRVPGALVGAASDPLGAVRGAFDAAASAGRMLRPVRTPLSPIMTGRSLSVRFDALSASLPAMKAAARRVDGRLNDAFVAAVAGGLDRYHRHHGEPVDELRMTMPINIREKGDVVAGNQFVPARFAFPVGIADPDTRMSALRELILRQRSEPALGLVAPIAGVLNRLPVSASTALFGGLLKAVDVVTSNVPGAPMPVYVAGARLEANFGFAPMTGAASNITLLSYVDDLHVAVSTDPAAVPDPDVYVECLQEGFDEIQKLA
jgi:diacylglycerol O-acyltransferase / wax synthase